MGDFWGPFSALILGFLAFAQFWVKILWDKYFRKGRIDYFETDNIAIGYDHSGPTLFLKGTIRALNQDVFIRTIDLLVIREKDKAQHIFKWGAFLSPIIDVSGSTPPPQEIPSSFMITPKSPHRFYILFRDSDLFKEIGPLLNSYNSDWYKTTEELNKIWSPLVGTHPTPTQVSLQSEVIEKFRKSKIQVETYDALKSKCYWEPGDYQLTINIKTSKPDKVFPITYRFSIAEEDSKKLKRNAITILEQPIANYQRVQNYPYSFAFSEYKKPEEH